MVQATSSLTTTTKDSQHALNLCKESTTNILKKLKFKIHLQGCMYLYTFHCITCLNRSILNFKYQMLRYLAYSDYSIVEEVRVTNDPITVLAYCLEVGKDRILQNLSYAQ